MEIINNYKLYINIYYEKLMVIIQVGGTYSFYINVLNYTIAAAGTYIVL